MMGRILDLTKAYPNAGVARCSFGELCDSAVGPADYLALARGFGTVVLEGVPVMGPQQHNEARRFISLLDVLYETNNRTIISAAAPPDGLFEDWDNNKLKVSSRQVSTVLLVTLLWWAQVADLRVDRDDAMSKPTAAAEWAPSFEQIRERQAGGEPAVLRTTSKLEMDVEAQSGVGRLGVSVAEFSGTNCEALR